MSNLIKINHLTLNKLMEIQGVFYSLTTFIGVFMDRFIKALNEDNSEVDEYDFIPVKNDSSDEHTKSLFEQLEEGDTQYTNIYDTVKHGANLYAKKTEGEYKNCLPIHIAAYNVDCNTEAISLILQTFDHPEERKKYIYLKDDSNRNALEILIEETTENPTHALPSIKSILSYLTADEQLEIIHSLSKEAKEILYGDETDVSREKDIKDLAQLNFFLKKGNTIGMCQQRRKEKALVLADYDSDEESLGKLDSVYNKKFTARVSYKDITQNDIVINSIPELILIPSDWRLETAIESHDQGDHVTAYVLLLSSFSHCKGENVKNLPELVYELAVNVLPDHANIFLQARQNINDVLNRYRKIRVEAIASLKAECDKKEIFISAVENNLKKAEIDAIARHIEDSIDQFITIINKLEDESFSQTRKKSITENYLLQQSIVILEKIDFLKEKKYSNFKQILFNSIRNVAEKMVSQNKSSITDKTLKNITEIIFKNILKETKIPTALLSKSGNLTQATLIDFLKRYVPLKKYHEGHAISHIKNKIVILEKTTDQTKRNEILSHIGFLCFSLFDYPKVNDEKFNNEHILYQAIPRHLIIINAAFSYLKQIPPKEKEILYDAFLNNILVLQLWEGHLVLNKIKKLVPLDFHLLKEKILEFASLDVNHNFSMKPKPPHPGITNIKKWLC